MHSFQKISRFHIRCLLLEYTNNCNLLTGVWFLCLLIYSFTASADSNSHIYMSVEDSFTCNFALQNTQLNTSNWEMGRDRKKLSRRKVACKTCPPIRSSQRHFNGRIDLICLMLARHGAQFLNSSKGAQSRNWSENLIICSVSSNIS